MHQSTIQPTTPHDDVIRRAVAACGVEREFWDIFGHHHVASPAALEAVLASLGLPAGDPEALARDLEERQWAEWAQVLPDTLVLNQAAQPCALPLSVPRDRARENVTVTFHWEDSSTTRQEVALGPLAEGGALELRGRAFVRKLLPLAPGAPLGYHCVTVESPDSALRGQTRLILHPGRCYQPEGLATDERGKRRLGGLAVSLYGLRSARNWGCGDTTDLLDLVNWAADEHLGDFVALNPLHSIPNRQPYNTSPYLPNGTFARNPLYIDVEAVAEWPHCPAAHTLRASGAVEQEIAELRSARYVEYERVCQLKLRFLRLLFATFQERELRAGTERARDFRRFVEREGDLLRRYALYCALDEHHHARDPDVWLWTDWPAEHQDPHSPAVAMFEREHAATAVRFHQWLQWLLDGQLAAAQRRAGERGMAIGLYHDLALATDRFGSDLWAHRDFYASGCRVGAPPDDFSPKGQDWSFPPPNTRRHREDGYCLFAESIRRNCRHGGALRIDHVMRFFRLYWIPDGLDATRGVYVRDRAEELLGVLALESVRQRVAIIGEDLGTVEPAVRDALARFGILSYRLLYFERHQDRSHKLPAEYPRQALVSASTHDLPTLAGFWEHKDIEARRDAGLLPDEASYRRMRADRDAEKQRLLDALHRSGALPAGYGRRAAAIAEFDGDLHSAVVQFLVSCPSALMVLNQEDLFKDPEQQNLPGSTEQYPNWRHKMRFALEELRTDPFALGCTAMFRHHLRQSGRV